MKNIFTKLCSAFSLLKSGLKKKQETVSTPEIKKTEKQESQEANELDAQQLMTKLSERLGVPINGEKGKWVLTFGGSSVYFQTVNSTFYIMAEVCPKLKKESEYEVLLKANFIGRNTGGAALGIDEDSIMLSQLIYSGTNYRQFEAHLANFIKVLSYWQEYMQKKEKEN